MRSPAPSRKCFRAAPRPGGTPCAVSASPSPRSLLAKRDMFPDRAPAVTAESLLTQVSKSSYRDSVALLMLARALRSSAGVREVAALMATDANKGLMAQSGLLTSEAALAGPNDLVVV